MPFRLTDFGLGFDEDARRQALKDALFSAGLTVMGQAPTQGFGAFSDGFRETMTNYRGGLQSMAQEREARLAEEEARRRQALADELAAEDREWKRTDRARQDEERASSATAKEQDMQARREVLGQIEDEALRNEAALRVAQPDFWEWLDKRREPKGTKAPVTRNFPDGTLREWDPEAGDWRILSRKPPRGDGKGSKKPGVNPYDQSRTEAHKNALARADKEIAEILKANAAGTTAPKPVPDRLQLAEQYMNDEMDASRFRRGLPPVDAVAVPDQLPVAPPPMGGLPTAAPPGAGAGAGSPATEQQQQELAALVEKRVAEMGLPGPVSQMRKSQILGRVRKLLSEGHSPEEILEELR